MSELAFTSATLDGDWGNEDRILAEPELGLFALISGSVGVGRSSADVALEPIQSRLADGAWTVEDLVGAAHAAVAHEREQMTWDDLWDWAAFLAMLLCRGKRAQIAHVGTVRVYRIRGTEAEQLTLDHTLGEELVRKGALRREKLSDAQRIVRIRSLGVAGANCIPEVRELEVNSGDRFLLCGEGLAELEPSLVEIAYSCGRRHCPRDRAGCAVLRKESTPGLRS